MDKPVIFFMKELRKIIATLLVAVVFLYFWINGPLLHTIETLSLESIETKFSKPIMVGKDGINNKEQSASFNTVKFNEEKTFGHGLIIEKRTPNKNYGFIADVKNNPGLSKEIEEKILKHATQFSENEQRLKVHPSIDMYYVTISDKNDVQPTIYLESTAIIKNVRGYAGEINIGIFIGADGYIKRIEHIASKETQSYLTDIKNAGFYDQFKTISITKGNQEIDAVSGATLSSEAIANTVSQLIEKGIPYPISNYADVDEVNLFDLSAILNSTWIIHITVIFLMFVFAIQKWMKKTKKSMLVLSILSVIYIGFFLNNSFTYISFIHPFLGTSISSLVGLYSLFVLLGAIWGKNTYCKYVCPFGNIQRLIIQVNPMKTSHKFFISNKRIKQIRAAIAVILLAGVLLGLRSWSNFELYPDLFGLQIVSVWFVVAIITVFLTIIYPMIWCRLLCPTGSLLDGITDLINYKRK